MFSFDVLHSDTCPRKLINSIPNEGADRPEKHRGDMYSFSVTLNLDHVVK